MSDSAATAFDLGFGSLGAEVSDRTLSVEGTVPGWLSGALIRNGPGKFEFGGRRVSHWFDGLALLRRYGFDDGIVTYTSRFLRTEAYRNATEGSGAKAGEFATDAGPLRTALRWLRSFGPPEPTDNANVHVARFGDHCVALTEAPRRVAFDPETLETRGEFRWTDDLTEHLTTAHVRVDPHRGETIGYSTELGRSPAYHLYRIPDGQAGREPIASVPAVGPGYVHDCSITASYVVLVETPLRIALLRALLPGSEGLLGMLEYDGERRSRFVVVDRDSGTVVAEPRVPPFFTFHHVNAYESDGEIVVDLVAFEDDGILEAMSFDSLSGGAFDGAPDGRLDRYRLDLESETASRSRRYDGGLELPTVPRAVRGRPYRYAYAQATDRSGANGLVKVDVERETATEWWERGVYVEEPRMVRRPGGTDEDDGVVLAPALDTKRERSVLLIFDAETLTELARAPLPHAVPFGFHGRFFPAQ
ncbi:carotenoid oxygenase family protein [Natronomonas sp. F2-12]|jgi:carotenoid cleavage dioxygenase-like enzyme|uniref:Carotenoid oxygenase family protein n=1 Tax=Natronomonas aquatica TaxID=2841590 RepID=A0A9R1CSB7_9EURY|nr:carotenoid oxygenase family protein [Natronomonas aquatica]MCQ4332796.1 carotenoid oxygenase family protein [Natronomonas aquatica]